MTAGPRRHRFTLSRTILLAATLASGMAAAALAAPATRANPSPAFLTNEDIVRLVINGTPDKVILNEIAARPVSFDFGEGVADELLRVGVSKTLIDAMRARQAEMDRDHPAPSGPVAGPPAGSSPEAAPAGAFDLVFVPSSGKGAADSDAIIMIASLPQGAPRPDDAEIGAVSDLALAVLCTTGDHVPDHWDIKTPLKEAPRHEVLLFRPGSTPEKKKGFDVLALKRDPVAPVAIAAGRHALLVVLAGKQIGSGAWRLLATAPLTIEVHAGSTTRLLLEANSNLSGSRMIGFHMQPTWTVREAPTPAGTVPS